MELADLLVVGEVDAGKSALLAALLTDQQVDTGKTQMLNHYHENIIDSPGEFVENRMWYNALISSMVAIKVIVFLQPANATRFVAPPGLFRIYADKQVVGVISKADLPDANVERAARLLEQNQIPKPYFPVSIYDETQLYRLKAYLATCCDAQKAPLKI